MKSLLPPNATELERNILDASSKHFETLSFPNQNLWNAEKCPLQLLDYLAWAIGVDSWNSGWTETEKRAVIKANFSVHSIKGTKQSLINALTPLNFSLKVVEWFEESPQGDPYTFSVEISSSSKSFSKNIYDELENIINNAKNVRSHLSSINVVSNCNLDCKSLVATVAGDITTIKPYAITERQSNGILYHKSAIATIVGDITTIKPYAIKQQQINGILYHKLTIYSNDIVTLRGKTNE